MDTEIYDISSTIDIKVPKQRRSRKQRRRAKKALSVKIDQNRVAVRDSKKSRRAKKAARIEAAAIKKVAREAKAKYQKHFDDLKIKLGRTPKLRDVVFESQNFQCYYCGVQMEWIAGCRSPISPTLDHVVPRVDGGLTVLDNLVGACSLCNSIKGSMRLEEFEVYRMLDGRTPWDELLGA